MGYGHILIKLDSKEGPSCSFRKLFIFMGFNFTWNEIPQKFPRRQVCKILGLYCILLRPTTNKCCVSDQWNYNWCLHPWSNNGNPTSKEPDSELKEQLWNWKSSFVAIVIDLAIYHSCKRFHIVELTLNSHLPSLTCHLAISYLFRSLYSSLTSQCDIPYPSITCPLPYPNLSLSLTHPTHPPLHLLGV